MGQWCGWGSVCHRWYTDSVYLALRCGVSWLLGVVELRLSLQIIRPLAIIADVINKARVAFIYETAQFPAYWASRGVVHRFFIVG